MPRRMSPARAEALHRGARFYIGPRCSRGHATGERYTSTNACRECVAGQPRPDRERRRPAVDEFSALLST